MKNYEKTMKGSENYTLGEQKKKKPRSLVPRTSPLAYSKAKEEVLGTRMVLLAFKNDSPIFFVLN